MPHCLSAAASVGLRRPVRLWLRCRQQCRLQIQSLRRWQRCRPRASMRGVWGWWAGCTIRGRRCCSRKRSCCGGTRKPRPPHSRSTPRPRPRPGAVRPSPEHPPHTLSLWPGAVRASPEHPPHTLSLWFCPLWRLNSAAAMLTMLGGTAGDIGANFKSEADKAKFLKMMGDKAGAEAASSKLVAQEEAEAEALAMAAEASAVGAYRMPGGEAGAGAAGGQAGAAGAAVDGKDVTTRVVAFAHGYSRETLLNPAEVRRRRRPPPHTASLHTHTTTQQPYTRQAGHCRFGLAAAATNRRGVHDAQCAHISADIKGECERLGGKVLAVELPTPTSANQDNVAAIGYVFVAFSSLGALTFSQHSSLPPPPPPPAA